MYTILKWNRLTECRGAYFQVRHPRLKRFEWHGAGRLVLPGDSTSPYKNTAYRANDGSSNIGDTYSYGGAGSAERAFGSLRSNALIPRFGAHFTNNTGHPIHALQVSYVGEQWRLGATGREADRLDFQLSTNATDLGGGSWTDYDLLDFSSPVTSGTVGALNGNAAANRAVLSHTITGLDIPNGGSFWIRWVDADVPDAHDGLAVDDFSLTPYTAPTAISLSGTSLPENAGANFPIGTLSGTDPDPGQSATLTFSLPAGQADNDLFVLAGTTLQARHSFDYEVRSSYTVVVRATDVTDLSRDETFLISVTDVNEAPAITSHGGAATAAISVPENTTAVTTLTASDPDGDTLTYSILGGADQAHFVLDAASGRLSFVSAPDFEQPADADADNVYEVTVQVSDGLLTATQSLLVTVSDVAEPPATISLSGTSLPENAGANFPIGTLSGTDPDPGQSATLTFSLPAGQADNDLFVLAGTTLQARHSFDYEVRSSYTVVVRATDVTDLSRDETFLISVTDVNEAPAITSHGGAATAAISVPENTTAVTTLTASDPDGDTLTYSILGGADQAHFVLDAASGRLSFVSAPDFEQPADADADNVYEVTVQVSDGLLTATQSLLITVSDVAEPPAAHTLVYTAGRGGSVEGEAKQVVKRGGEGTAVSAVPQSGYHFVRWSDGLRTATRVDSDVTSDIWVKALFEHDATVVTHALSYSAGVGGSIRGEASQIVEDGGTGAEVEAVPDSGYRFLVWSDGVQSARRVDTGVSADLSVVAEFAPVGVGANRWTDIGDQEWVDVYGVTACQVDMVADGLNDGRFGPGLAVNRSQFAKMVVDGFGLPKHAPFTPSFNDVDAAHFFFEWIEGAAALNVVLGYEDRGFRPEWSITRQQACSILGRHLAQQEMGQSGSIRGELGSYTSVEQWYETEGVSLLAPFADAARVFTVHAPYTAYLLYHEVIWGSLSEGQCLLDPLSDLTRSSRGTGSVWGSVDGTI